MGAYVRGNSITLVQRCYEVDPLTEVATLADPTTAVFTVENPNGVSTVYTFGVDPEVTHPSTGIYLCALDPQLPVGIYPYRFDGAGALDIADEGTFTVLESAVLPPDPAESATYGPCNGWIEGFDVAEFDPSLGVGSNSFELDVVANAASELMFALSGRQFNGVCERTVRPCRQGCGCWAGGFGGLGPYAWGNGWAGTYGTWGFGSLGWWDECGDRCGCGVLSTVELSGYPIRQITEVKIGGVVLDEFDGDGNRNWRLDKRRQLVRMDTPGDPVRVNRWPGCQNLALDDTETGTFSVTYTWGMEPPEFGKLAACQLAAELFKVSNGGACSLAPGVTRVARLGITIDKLPPLGLLLSTGSTGLQLVDAFIAMVNPTRMTRRPAVYSPDLQPFARRLGQ